MEKIVEIKIEKYKCLREHLTKSIQMIDEVIGNQFGSDSKKVASKPTPKETKKDKVNKYLKKLNNPKK